MILIQGFLCSCDRNKSSKCYKGIGWEDELCIKAFWWFCKADLLAILEQNSSHAFAPVFKQTEGEGDAPGGCRRKVETICGNLFSTCEFERIVSWLSLE